ncbi:MAG: trypsin-like serine peptidase [Planctomycetota bacterium]
MRLLLAVATLTAVASGDAIAQTTLDRPVGRLQPYPLDSGPVSNPADFSAPMFAEPVAVEGAGWLRLYFGPATTLKPGTFIRITSTADGEVQQLDSATLSEWGGTSAYFNGDTVIVELVAGPGTSGNRVTVEQIAIPTAGAEPLDGSGMCGICGPDERVSSDELWTGRLLPVGCTASVWSQTSCMVSAGHCIGQGMVVQFDVPGSNPDCTLNHPPVADQFPILDAQFVDAGVGHDWSVLIPGSNGLGQLPYERYGQLRPIASALPGDNEPVAVWGYGVDDTCVVSQTQQSSGGSTTGVFADHYQFDVDVAGGNSGSALVHNGEIIAVVTHCDPDCPNAGTRVDHGSFAQARDELCGASLQFTFPGGLPQTLDLQGETEVRVVVGPDSDAPLPGTGVLHLSVDGGPYVASPMAAGAPNDYTALFPAINCGSVATFYFSAVATGGDTVKSPRQAPYEVYTAIAATGLVPVFEDDFETDRGWTVAAAGGLTDGQWQRAVPIASSVCDRGNPGGDADGSGRCYVTDNDPSNCDSDVDDGSAVLLSPVMDASQGEAIISYRRWFSTIAGSNPFQDTFVVEVSGDGGATWSELETVGPTGREAEGGWFARSFRVTDVAVATGQVTLRFVASDTEPPSVVEAGVDGVRLVTALCAPPCPWDLDGGGVGISDFLVLLAQWGTDPSGPPDFDADGTVGITDFLLMLAHWGPCPQ